MGIVYLAWDPQTKRHVAIKALRDGQQQNRQALLDEARTVSQIRNPNVVAIHDLIRDQQSQSTLLVLEYVAGVTLAEFFELPCLWDSDRQFLVNLKSALFIFEQCLKGLRAAHKAGITHQDIKPENYLVTQEVVDALKDMAQYSHELEPDEVEELFLERRSQPWIKLSDLGMGLTRDATVQDVAHSISFGLSQIPSHKRGGTFLYMPPEQFDGVGISRTTDVFGLGLILYQCLTGHDAREARRYAEQIDDPQFKDLQAFLVAMASSKASTAVAPHSDPHLRARSLPKPVKDLLEAMTQRDKSERWSSEAVEATLQEWLQDNGQLAIRRARPSLWLFALPILLAACIGLILRLQQPKRPELFKNPPVKNPPVKNPLVNGPRPKPVPQALSPAQAVLAGDIDKHGELELLNPELCRVLIKDASAERVCPKLLSLDRATALVLASTKVPWSFPGIERLSQDIIDILAYSDADIRLPGAFHAAWKKARARVVKLESEVAKGELKSLEKILRIRAVLAPVLKRKYSKKSLKFESVLTVELDMLRLLQGNSNRLQFSSLEAINLELAKAFGQCKCKYLSLNGLTEVDLSCARELARHDRGLLYLRGLKDPSAEVLQVLMACPSKLRLNLQSINDQQARALSRRQRGLFIGGLGKLSPFAAQCLSKVRGDSLVIELKSLSPEAANAFQRAACRHLFINRLEELSPEAAKFLGDYPGEQLGLHYLRHLSPASAQELARFRGKVLGLNHIEVLSPQTAEALSGYKGELCLKYLGQLKTDQAKKFRDFQGLLDLSEMHKTTDSVIEALAFNGVRVRLRRRYQKYYDRLMKDLQQDRDIEIKIRRGDLSAHAELRRLNPQLAELLSKTRRFLRFASLKHLDIRSARAIARYRGPELSFPALEDLNPEAAMELMNYPGKLYLKGLTRLDPTLAKALATKNVGELWMIRVDSLSSEVIENLSHFRAEWLVLDKLTELPVALGQAFSKRPSHFRFNGVTTMTVAQAQAWASHDGRLRMRSLKLKDPKVLKALAKHIGPVDIDRKHCQLFNAYRRPRPEIQERIRKGDLEALRFLVDLPPDIAKQLARSQLKRLRFVCLTQLSEESAKWLALFPGDLSFAALIDHSPKVMAALAEHRYELFFYGPGPWPIESIRAIARHKGPWISADCFEQLTARQAQEFAKSKNNLRFQRLESMSEKTAQALSKHTATLRFQSGHRFSSKALSILASHKGEVIYFTRSKFTPEQLKALMGYQGVLAIEDWTRLPAEYARIFSLYKGRGLWLDGLRALDAEAAHALKAFKGKIRLRRLRRLSDGAARVLKPILPRLEIPDAMREQIQAVP